MLSLAGQIPGVEAVSLTDTMEAALRYEDYQAAVFSAAWIPLCWRANGSAEALTRTRRLCRISF